MDICAEIQRTIDKLTSYKENVEKASDVLDELETNKVFSKKEYDLRNQQVYNDLISSLSQATNNKGGIYLFGFEDDKIESYKKDFIKQYDKRKKAVTYNLSKINTNCKYSYLYIGKNEKDIDKRILEHLNCASDSTYAMKLKDDKTFGTDKITNHLKLTTYYFNGEVGWTEKLILSLLKKELHEKYKPMLGGSRV